MGGGVGEEKVDVGEVEEVLLGVGVVGVGVIAVEVVCKVLWWMGEIHWRREKEITGNSWGCIINFQIMTNLILLSSQYYYVLLLFSQSSTFFMSFRSLWIMNLI